MAGSKSAGMSLDAQIHLVCGPLTDYCNHLLFSYFNVCEMNTFMVEEICSLHNNYHSMKDAFFIVLFCNSIANFQ